MESTGTGKRDMGLKRRNPSGATIGSPLDSVVAKNGVHLGRGIAEIICNSRLLVDRYEGVGGGSRGV